MPNTSASQLIQQWSSSDPDRALARQLRHFRVRSSSHRLQVHHRSTLLLAVQRRPDGSLHATTGQDIWARVQLPENQDRPNNPLHQYSMKGLPTDITLPFLVQQILASGTPDPAPTAATAIKTGDWIQSIISQRRPQRLQQLNDQLHHAVQALLDPDTRELLAGVIRTDHEDTFSHHHAQTRHPVTPWHYNTARHLGQHLLPLIETNPGIVTWLFRNQTTGPEIRHPGQIIRLARTLLELQGVAKTAWKACTTIPVDTMKAITEYNTQWATSVVINLTAHSQATPSETIARWAHQYLQTNHPITMKVQITFCINNGQLHVPTGPAFWTTQQRTAQIEQAISQNERTALRLIFQESAAKPDQQQRQLREEARDLMDYVEDADHHGITLLSRTFGGITRHSQSWHRTMNELTTEQRVRDILRTREPLEWTSLLPQTDIGDITASPLTTELQLIQEGIDMRHCVGHYGPRCAQGSSRLFSLQKLGDTIATAEISLLDDTWKPAQVRGRLNSPAPPEAARAATSLAHAYNNAWRQKSQQAGHHRSGQAPA